MMDILYDEKQAIEDIKKLPIHIKMHLQHVFRNNLQSIAGAIEMHHLEDAKDIIFLIERNLRGLGL